MNSEIFRIPNGPLTRQVPVHVLLLTRSKVWRARLVQSTDWDGTWEISAVDKPDDLLESARARPSFILLEFAAAQISSDLKLGRAATKRKRPEC